MNLCEDILSLSALIDSTDPKGTEILDHLETNLAVLSTGMSWKIPAGDYSEKSLRLLMHSMRCIALIFNSFIDNLKKLDGFFLNTYP